MDALDQSHGGPVSMWVQVFGLIKKKGYLKNLHPHTILPWLG